jgi:hypothetical protein
VPTDQKSHALRTAKAGKVAFTCGLWPRTGRISGYVRETTAAFPGKSGPEVAQLWRTSGPSYGPAQAGRAALRVHQTPT